LFGVVRSAWLCDDAFITLRTVDNFVNGFGLTWNVDERVQAYTHPLWMLLLSGFYALTREPYYTTIFVSLAVTAAFLALFVRAHVRASVPGVLALGALAVSKSLADYSTSGLENPLTHLFLTAALWLFLDGGRTPKALAALALLGALGALNRPDALLFYVPLLATSAWRLARARGWRRTLLPLFVGGLPLLAWELFSFFYYGSLVPNTALAKLATGVATTAYLRQGLDYWLCSALVDPVPCLAGLAALSGVFVQRRWELLPVLAAIALELLYLLRIGGDFMVGRHFAAPLVAAAVVLARLRHARWGALVLGLAWLAYGLLPHSPLRAGPDYTALQFRHWLGATSEFAKGIGDERGRYYPRLGLLRSAGAKSPRTEDPAEEGRTVRREIEAEGSAQRVTQREAVGQFGYYAGPRAIVIDALALCDPLLARLPTVNPHAWRIGHFTRRIPDGYLESRRSGTNQIQDPDLAIYYDSLKEVVSGELWSRARLRTASTLLAGRLDDRLAAYVARAGPPRVRPR
jgi:arabinofuranosyltransferase